MSASYPEIRPYTNPVPRKGYCAKPKTAVPYPPTEALAILKSRVGFDVPSTARPLSGLGVRLPALESALDGTTTTAAGSDVPITNPTLMLPADRSSNAALTEAKLEDPFAHRAHTYHNCQQAVLNAELRRAVEKFLADWKKKLEQLKVILNHYPGDCREMAAATLDAMKAYGSAYKCTEDLSVSTEELIEMFKLTCSKDEMDQIAKVSTINLEFLHRSLQALLNSPVSLAPLDQYAAMLEVFDRIAGVEVAEEEEGESRGTAALVPEPHPEGGAEVARVGSGSDQSSSSSTSGESAPPLRPSTTAVVLHERFHFDPVEFTNKELKKMEKPILTMEERVFTAKERKEEAIEHLHPADALRHLHAQVDFSNDLLLMNKSRMLLVSMHQEDVREYRAEVIKVIESARCATELLRARVADLLPRVQNDLGVVQKAADDSRERILELEKEEQLAQEDMARGLRTYEVKELDLWSQMLQLMHSLQELSAEKRTFCAREMSAREKRGKVWSEACELLRAQETHADALEVTEATLHRWASCGEMYDKYVTDFEPKLITRVETLEEEDEALNRVESQDYVRRYELFTYGAEEARAKRVVQADRMRLQQRASYFDTKIVLETLDPNHDRHAEKIDEAEKELEEVLAYIEYIHNIEHDRREEIEPVLRKVLQYNRSIPRGDEKRIQFTDERLLRMDRGDQSTEEGTSASSTDVDSEGKHVPIKGAGTAVGGTGFQSGALVTTGVLSSKKDKDAILPATMEHPQVTARLVGMAHEEAYTDKHQRLNDEELRAGEEKIGGIKKSKTELLALGVKYKNTAYVQAIAAQMAQKES